MPELVEHQAIVENFESIITGAEEWIIVASPVLSFRKELFVKLAEAATRGIRLTIVTGSEPDPVAAQLLSVLRNTSVHCIDGFNARIIYNEKVMLITSMSLEDLHAGRTLDYGLLVKKTEEGEVFVKTDLWIKLMIDISATFMFEPGSAEYSLKTEKRYQGFCVYCGIPVSFNSSKPFCGMCSGKARDGDSGTRCHSCGTTFNREQAEILCDSCK